MKKLLIISYVLLISLVQLQAQVISDFEDGAVPGNWGFAAGDEPVVIDDGTGANNVLKLTHTSPLTAWWSGMIDFGDITENAGANTLKIDFLSSVEGATVWVVINKDKAKEVNLKLTKEDGTIPTANEKATLYCNFDMEGVDLQTMWIGIGDDSTEGAGVAGTFYVDNVRLEGGSDPVEPEGPLFGRIMDFEDGSVEGWTTYTDAGKDDVYTISNESSTLKIDYNRTLEHAGWSSGMENKLPIPIDPSGDPRVRLKYKTDVALSFGFKVVYTADHSVNDFYQIPVDGDNQWHDLELDLFNYVDQEAIYLYMFMDGGSVVEKTGAIYVDDIIVGADRLLLKIQDLTASADGTDINLLWGVNFSANTKEYKVYRGLSTDFVCDETSLVTTTTETSYSDTGLEANEVYYYKIIPVDTDEVVHKVSDVVSSRTYVSTGSITAFGEEVNGSSIGLYDQYLLDVYLYDAVYDNPYDYEEIDISAVFTAPGGKEWKIFGYYDNYNKLDKFRMRFSANEIGEWSYVLSAKDKSGATFTGEAKTFTVAETDCEAKGWIKVSENNPRFFEYDNGESFYGVGAYYPWPGMGNAEQMLDKLQNAGGNFWGYWTTVIDNGRLIESLDSGLGKYDQLECGRIDDLLQWSEDRGMVVEFTPVTHVMLDIDITGYSEWESNPYKEIVAADKFFTDELAWDYLHKQLRYLIARYSSYRSFGIWEIINELNLTEQWFKGGADGQQAGLDWVKKMNDYIKANDAYQHPTTANAGGGFYDSRIFDNIDISNVHLYETGWQSPDPGNPMRASLLSYAKFSNKMRNDQEKPYIMGEAGYLDTYGEYAAPSAEYTELYHNAMWTTWACGNASAPLWWELNTTEIMSDDVLAEMKTFSEMSSKVDYAASNYTSSTTSADQMDVFAMVSDSTAYGWVRQLMGGDAGNKEFTMSVKKDTVYAIDWYFTNSATLKTTTYARATDGQLTLTVPSSFIAIKDMAFIIEETSNENMAVSEFKSDEFELVSYPNPFKNSTTVRYKLGKSGYVNVSVFNMKGQLVETLVDETQSAGKNEVVWNADGTHSGVYFCKITTGNYSQSAKLILKN